MFVASTHSHHSRASLSPLERLTYTHARVERFALTREQRLRTIRSHARSKRTGDADGNETLDVSMRSNRWDSVVRVIIRCGPLACVRQKIIARELRASANSKMPTDEETSFHRRTVAACVEKIYDAVEG